ncbi:holin family protein [Ruegeria pomeroyi]|uniref:Holin family protein n=2 Tax=root TaxID=1 RepID=A0A850LN68_9RHOB|nr:holin family protein [Ruegeria pomeroyi]NVK99478.1 holin family protein [Ruegeria pomeroyi]NVL00680.1 holin family protein [Ruegeria pomeroyi]QWV08731.1 holin family protein [Ruegeria pomeroyi]DBA12292.1 TPA_asm: holin family protein [Ruegerigtaviriform cheni]
MGLIGDLLGMLFGGGRNAVRETVEVFRENAEAGAARATQVQMGALDQFAAEFAQRRRGWFDRFMDGLNRLPRPALALGTLGLFIAAMADPIWFGERMQGLALVPEPLWWLLGVIVSFYFGARHQAKTQDFQRDLAATMARVPQAVENIRALRALRHDSPGVADAGPDARLALAAAAPEENPALEDWRRLKRA